MALDKMFGIGIVVSAVDKVTGPLRRVNSSMAGTQKSARALGMSMLKVGAGMTIAGAVMAGFSIKMAKSTMDIEDAATAFRTVATPIEGSVVRAYDLAIESALKFSRVNSQTATEYLQAAYQMGSAGLETKTALMATEWGLKIATATMADSVEATQLLGVTYINLGNQSADVGTEMNRLADMLTKTQQAFLFPSLQPLVEGMKYATPAAKAYRVSLEQTLPIMGMLNTAGLVGSLAGTAFKATLDRLGEASRKFGINLRYTKEGNLDLIGFLEDLRRKFGLLSKAPMEVQEVMKKAFGRYGKTMIQLLSGQEGALRNYEVAMVHAGGITEKTAALMESTLSARLNQMKNTFTALAYQLGVVIVPALKTVVDAVAKIGISFGKWLEAYPAVVKIGMTIMAVGGVVLTVLGIITMLGGALLLIPFGTVFSTGVAALGAFLAAVAPVILIVGALAGAAYILHRNIENLFGGLMAVIGGLAKGMDMAVGLIKEQFEWLWSLFAEFPARMFEIGREFVFGLAGGMWSAIWAPAEAVEGIVNLLIDYLPAFSPAKKGPLKNLDKIGPAIPIAISEGIDAHGGKVSASIIEMFKDTPLKFVEAQEVALGSTIKEFLKSIPEAIGAVPIGFQPAFAEATYVTGAGLPLAETIPLPDGGVGGGIGGGIGKGFDGGDYGFGGGGAMTITNYYTVHVEQGSVVLPDGGVAGDDFDDRVENALDRLMEKAGIGRS